MRNGFVYFIKIDPDLFVRIFLERLTILLSI